MKKIFTLTSILILSKFTFCQTPVIDQHWVLQWDDNFTTLDYYTDGVLHNVFGNQAAQTARWLATDDFDHGGEPQAYVKANTSKDNSIGAVLTAKREEYLCLPCTSVCSTCPYQYHHYTSGAITSFENIQFGYVEARIKLSDNYGLFPAFWTQVHGVIYNEIDIFEMTPGSLNTDPASLFYNQVSTKNIMTNNLHISDNDISNLNFQAHYINNYTQWHTYGLEWTPSKLIYYIDGQAIRNSENPNYSLHPSLGGDINIPTGIVLNLALYNFVAYAQSPNEWYLPTDYPIDYLYFEPLPAYASYNPVSINAINPTMEIEYVKYYTLDETECSNSLLITDNSGLNSYDFKIRKDIVISPASPVNVTGSSPTALRASDYILINGDFTADGYDFYLDVNPCQ
jgi:hypothetical protein